MDGYVYFFKDKDTRVKLKKSLTKDADRFLVLCEQIRFVYDIVYEMPEGETKDLLTERLIDAFGLAKKMGDRLDYYRSKYKDQTGNHGKNIVYLEHNKSRMYRRKKRL